MLDGDHLIWPECPQTDESKDARKSSVVFRITPVVCWSFSIPAEVSTILRFDYKVSLQM